MIKEAMDTSAKSLKKIVPLILVKNSQNFPFLNSDCRFFHDGTDTIVLDIQKRNYFIDIFKGLQNDVKCSC